MGATEGAHGAPEGARTCTGRPKNIPRDGRKRTYYLFINRTYLADIIVYDARRCFQPSAQLTGVDPPLCTWPEMKSKGPNLIVD